MKKLNNEHTFLIISTDKKLEIFLPVLAKYGYTYNKTISNTKLDKNSKIIVICLDVKYVYVKTFWAIDYIHKGWETQEDVLLIENCSVAQLESVLCECGSKKMIQLSL